MDRGLAGAGLGAKRIDSIHDQEDQVGFATPGGEQNFEDYFDTNDFATAKEAAQRKSINQEQHKSISIKSLSIDNPSKPRRTSSKRSSKASDAAHQANSPGSHKYISRNQDKAQSKATGVDG